MEVAIQTEDAAKVAKETVFGPKSVPALAIAQKTSRQQPVLQRPPKKEASVGQQRCSRCGNSGHIATSCKFKEAKCNFRKLTGYLEAVCRKKARSKAQAQGVKWIDVLEMVKAAPCPNSEVQKLQVPIYINGKAFTLELDTAAGGNFISTRVWTEQRSKPKLQQAQLRYHSARKHTLPIIGAFNAEAKYGDVSKSYPFSFLVSEIPDLNLLGRDAIRAMRISLGGLLFSETTFDKTDLQLLAIPRSDHVDRHLQQACRYLYTEFSELFKPEFGCLRGVQLVVEFKPDARPIFCKPRSVPFAMQEELAQAYDVGIARGIWTPTSFNDCGAPVVPVRKAAQNSNKPALGVCGDYSVTVNPQLETHRHPLPLPEELMRRLGGGYGFTKIDLADAYNQVRLGPKRRERFALSTHRGVLLQNVLPFVISFAPGYCQQVMEEITSDPPGVAVYLDDILCSGTTAEAHLQNLRRLLERLCDKALRFRLGVCLRPATSGLLGARAVQRRNSPRSKVQCPQRDVSTA